MSWVAPQQIQTIWNQHWPPTRHTLSRWRENCPTTSSVNLPADSTTISPSTSVLGETNGNPTWWLKSVGFHDGPPQMLPSEPPSLQKAVPLVIVRKLDDSNSIYIFTLQRSLGVVRKNWKKKSRRNRNYYNFVYVDESKRIFCYRLTLIVLGFRLIFTRENLHFFISIRSRGEKTWSCESSSRKLFCFLKR